MKSRKEAFRKKMVALELRILKHHRLWDRIRKTTPDGSFAMRAWLSGYRAGKRDSRGKA